MTQNQINYKAHKENERANKEKERENLRSNVQRETEAKKRRLQDRDLAIAKSATKLVEPLANAATGFLLGGNHPSWYNLDKQMVNDVANISYATPLGMERNPINKRTVITGDGSLVTIESNSTVPGLLVIPYIPTIGSDDIATTAGLNIYAYIRHANSGSRNYEYQDLMKYLYAMDSIYIGIAELKRIYSIANTYKGYNRYYSEAYIAGILNNTSFKIRNINLADLRYHINNMINKANSLYVPNVMSLFLRHTWLSSNIFKDSPIKKSQNYIFINQFGYKYDEVDNSPSFGQLVPHSLLGNTIEDSINNVYDLIYALQNSEDIGIMSGDILKAYGNGNMFMIPSISEDYHVEEIYDESVLTQVSAATVYPTPLVHSFLIYEDPDTHKLTQGYNQEMRPIDGYTWTQTKGKPLFVTGRKYPISSLSDQAFPSHDIGILNMFKDDVNPDDNMVASRLLSTADLTYVAINDAINVELSLALSSCGSEIITVCRMVRFELDPESHTINSTIIGPYYDGMSYQLNDISEFIQAVSCFRWAPLIRVLNPSDNFTVLYTNKDLNNYAVVSKDTIERMHHVAVNSELGVPLLGTKVRS